MVIRGGVWPTGSGSLFPLDQLQYMALVRETGHLHHVLDHFPMFLISGLGFRAGLDVRLAFLLWVPVAAVVMVWGFGLYVRTLLPTHGAQTVALVLALFYLSPFVALLAWTKYDQGDSFAHLVFTSYYLFPAGSLWGYPQIAITLGLMPICLLYALPGAEPRRSALAPIAGALISFLHPWQGVTVLVIHAITAATSAAARTKILLITLLATGAPLAYYRLASASDPRLELTDRNTLLATAPLWVVLAALAPLLIAFAGIDGKRLDTLRERQLVIWPLVSLLCYWRVDVSWQPYFLLGTTLPLAILAVRGANRISAMRRTSIAVFAVAAVTIPGVVFATNFLRQREYGEARQLYALKSADARALDYVEHQKRPGSVLGSGFLAPAAWAFTGRTSWAATPLVSPEYTVGKAEAAKLFEGRISARGSRRFVARTDATFVVQGCDEPVRDLATRLGPLLRAEHRVGCATVYELKRASSAPSSTPNSR
ncbi:MAG: hypothetical protein QOJ29_4648 [Thermoleophilaceae bacterium]|nr:hypothetical protein [Thermoleophilaceae bacterium]